MPKHISLGTVVEKNRIASKEAFIILCEIEVVDSTTGDYVETLRLARNNEDILFQGNTYVAVMFDFDSQETSEGVPDLTVTIQDPTQSVMSRTEQHEGGVGWKVRFKLINTGDMTADPEIEEMVYVIAANAQDYIVQFSLGARNPLAQRFPRNMQWRDRCSWKFKDSEGCKYTGPETFCDYTLQGPDGCSVKGNSLRFRGLPGIRPR